MEATPPGPAAAPTPCLLHTRALRSGLECLLNQLTRAEVLQAPHLHCFRISARTMLCACGGKAPLAAAVAAQAAQGGEEEDGEPEAAKVVR